jgi:hypothetical protein
VKIQKVIRRVSGDGGPAVNAVVAANIGETGNAEARSVQHVEVIQRKRGVKGRPLPTDKEPRDR